MSEADDFIEVTNHDVDALKKHYWYNGDLEWKFDDLQRRISATVNSLPHAKKICILSSRQIGKSYWSVGHTLEFLIRHPETIARIVAPTLSNCHDIVGDNLISITLDAPPTLFTRKRSEMRWQCENGSTLRLGALERAHVDAMNRGGNASLIIYEECGFVKSDDFVYGVNSVLGPQLLRSNGRELFVSSPPEDVDHYLITQIKPECEELGTFFSFTVLDSPTITPDQVIEAAIRSGCVLSDEFIHGIREWKINTSNVHEWAARTNSSLSDAFRREFLAEIVRSSSLMVVPDFSDTPRHVRKIDPPSRCFWTVTIDWGGVRDKTCAILHTYDYMSNTHLIVDERVFEPNTPTSEIVEVLRLAWHNQYPIRGVWADVHGQTQIDLNQAGYPVSLPQKTDWLGSVQSMAVKFTTDRIVISPKCEFIRRSCRTGMFNKNKTDFERSSGLGHCDGLAALMYGLRSQDVSNPYVETSARDANMMILRQDKKRSEEALSTALTPKTFGEKTSRSFGSFKK